MDLTLYKIEFEDCFLGPSYLCYKEQSSHSYNAQEFPFSIGCLYVRFKVLTFVEYFPDEFIIAI